MEGTQSHTKLIINLRDGLLEVEGHESFVRSIYDDFRGQIAERSEPPRRTGPSSASQKTDRATSRGESRVKTSCGARIRELTAEGFFDKQQALSNVTKKFEENATPYESKHVSAALNFEVKNRRLRRMKKDNAWSYVRP